MTKKNSKHRNKIATFIDTLRNMLNVTIYLKSRLNHHNLCLGMMIKILLK